MDLDVGLIVNAMLRQLERLENGWINYVLHMDCSNSATAPDIILTGLHFVDVVCVLVK